MDPRLGLALSIGRVSRVDADEASARALELNLDVFEVLQGMGLVDAEEALWLEQIGMQGYNATQLEAMRGEWDLARVAWAARLFPRGAETLPRQLLRTWSQGDPSTLLTLHQERRLSSQGIEEAARRLAHDTRVCRYCLDVNEESYATQCQRCQRPLPEPPGAPKRRLECIYDLLPGPSPRGLADPTILASSLQLWVESQLRRGRGG